MANNCPKFAHHACHARVVFETQFTLLVIGCRNFVKQSCNLLRLKAKKECQSSLYLKSSVLLHGFQRSFFSMLCGIHNCIKWALRNQSVSNVSVLPWKKLRLQDPLEDNHTNVSTSTQRWAPYVFCIAHKSADSSRTDSLPIFGA